MKTSHTISNKSFAELSSEELYKIIALRMAVFCVEQNCPYQDLDSLDQEATHVMVSADSRLIAYARILSHSDDALSIGRVVVDPKNRGSGIAKTLMKHCIDQCIAMKPDQKIIISAQSYLQKFYYDLGFESMGEFYLEDDIPHEKMIYRNQS